MSLELTESDTKDALGSPDGATRTLSGASVDTDLSKRSTRSSR